MALFFLALSAECCQQHPGTGEASAGGDSGKTTPAPTGASPTVSITNGRKTTVNWYYHPSRAPWQTDRNRHQMKHKEFCSGTRSFNLSLGCQGSQTVEKAVDPPPSEMLRPHLSRALCSLLEVICFSKGWTPQEPSSLIHPVILWLIIPLRSLGCWCVTYIHYWKLKRAAANT